MKRKLTGRQTPLLQPNDLVSDTAILLQRVGVVQIDEMALDKAIHDVIDAQALVSHAAILYMNRRQNGLITFEQLMLSLVKEAA